MLVILQMSVCIASLQKVRQCPVINRDEQIFHPVCTLRHTNTTSLKQTRYTRLFSHTKQQKCSDLLSSDQFMISEFGELCTKRDVTVHQERLTTALVKILEG